MQRSAVAHFEAWCTAANGNEIRRVHQDHRLRWHRGRVHDRHGCQGAPRNFLLEREHASAGRADERGGKHVARVHQPDQVAHVAVGGDRDCVDELLDVANDPGDAAARRSGQRGNTVQDPAGRTAVAALASSKTLSTATDVSSWMASRTTPSIAGVEYSSISRSKSHRRASDDVERNLASFAIKQIVVICPIWRHLKRQPRWCPICRHVNEDRRARATID